MLNSNRKHQKIKGLHTLISLLLCGMALICPNTAKSQHYRGLSVIDDNQTWMSGTKGHILRTLDGGQHWDTFIPEGYSTKDFRDIHAWNANHAVVMSAGDSSVLLETKDAGKSWSLIYSDLRPGSFFDAIDVRNNDILLVGDGVAAQNPYIVYIDKKRNIHSFTTFYFSQAQTLWSWGFKTDTFSFFAASGTNVQWIGKNRFLMIPVGRDSTYCLEVKLLNLNPTPKANPEPDKSKFLQIEQYSVIPFPRQKAGGAYSMCYANERLVAVGGSFYAPDVADSAAFFKGNGQSSWEVTQANIGGYRSCVCYHTNEGRGLWIATGPNGTNVSNSGLTWKPSNKDGYNVCASSGHYVWFAGNKGRWKRVTPESLITIQP